MNKNDFTIANKTCYNNQKTCNVVFNLTLLKF